jgi:DNA invertase Pin-like site-specific DNA recombinase
MRVALYLRRSTGAEMQPESLATQEEQLRSFATFHEDDVIRVYRDDASGRNANRKAFQSLMADVRSGADFDRLLVLDVTRWGRFENVDESAYWEFFCLLHGVRVVYVNEPFRDESAYDGLIKTIKRLSAAEFSKDKSRMVQYTKARSARKGNFTGGSPPYGMKRLLVRNDGTVLQPLEKGEWKGVGTYRVKLAPGDPREVATVKRIYKLFLQGKSLSAIARQLDAEGIPTPKNATRGWHCLVIRKILYSPVYAGVSVLRCKPSSNFPNGETITVPRAWPAIIAMPTWEAAQRRQQELLLRHTPMGLADQLRRAYENHGVLNKRAHTKWSLPKWETYLRHFNDGTQEALALAYQNTIKREERQIVTALRRHFTVTRDETGILILDGLLRVRLLPSFPRMIYYGLFWEFRFHETDQHDVTICIGLSPPPIHRMQMYLFHNALCGKKARTLHANLSGKGKAQPLRRTMPEIVASLKRSIVRDSRSARDQFTQFVRTHQLPTTTAIAKELGWTPRVAQAMYDCVRRHGTKLPALKYAHKPPVTVICSACKMARPMVWSQALVLKTTYCRRCYQQTRRPKVPVTCPECGKVRLYCPSALRTLHNGTQTICNKCRTGDPVRARAQRRLNNAARKRTMTRLAELVRESLSQRYANVRFLLKPGRLAPWISWSEKNKVRQQVLRLVCSLQNSLKLTRHEPELPTLARRLIDRRRWHRANDRDHEIWNVQIPEQAD